MPGPEILGVAEVAARIGLKASTVQVMSSRGELPPPDVVANAGRTRLWRPSTIDAWDAERKRR